MKAQDETKAIVKERTGIMDAADPTGKGGSTNKGDVCQRLLTDHRDVLVDCVPQRFQQDFRKIMDIFLFFFYFQMKYSIHCIIFFYFDTVLFI